MSDRDPVDLVYLHKYTSGDAALEREVYALFREQVSMWMKLLKVDSDNQSWGSAAHSIKGSARGLGAHGLASACEAAEAVIASGRTARASAAADVRVHVDAVLAFLAQREYALNIQDLRKPSKDLNS